MSYQDQVAQVLAIVMGSFFALAFVVVVVSGAYFYWTEARHDRRAAKRKAR